jgi:hypothetical protein
MSRNTMNVVSHTNLLYLHSTRNRTYSKSKTFNKSRVLKKQLDVFEWTNKAR